MAFFEKVVALNLHKRPGFLVGAFILTMSALLALFPGLFAPFDPNAFNYSALKQPPSADHWFGTDNLGRDTFSRVIWAYSINMQMAIVATVFAMLIGVVVGALVGWVYYARLMRAEIMGQMANEYATAGKVIGCSDMRIIFRHLMPNAITPVLTYWMTDMALAILLGSSLGYLGLGAQPPAAEWGVLIAEGRNFITTAWWLSLMPGIATILTGLGFSLVGDSVADLMRPRG